MISPKKYASGFEVDLFWILVVVMIKYNMDFIITISPM